MKEFKEHDIVIASTDIKKRRLLIKKGTPGTIVHIYDEKNFEVEFMSGDDNIVETVTIDKIKKVK